jgi:hypothetical protein
LIYINTLLVVWWDLRRDSHLFVIGLCIRLSLELFQSLPSV